ncbi:MAG: pyridoxal phosphate-dependent aminotransferase [Hyphomicrobiaceae bacterium]
MSCPRYTPLVASLPATVPFVGPETQERSQGRQFRARIGANESVFGPSPHAIEAMAQAATEIWKYGDPENHDLKHALARHHNVRPENIVVGEGIDGLLGYLARMVVSEGTPVATSLGAYPTFNFHIAGFGGRLCTVPYRDDAEDPEALIDLAEREQTPLIYFANPDNPMGSWHSADVVQRLIDRVPDGGLLCLDEAYIEFAPQDTAPPIDVSNPRVIRFRTFSKAYGMAGARVGYGIAEEDLATAFNKVRNHFGVNRIAQSGALAALADEAYLAEVQAKVSRACTRITDIALANGLHSLPTATNFVTIDCGRDDAYAKAVVAGLVARDVFVRMPFVAPQNRCIRVTAGTADDLDTFADALPKVLASVKVEQLITAPRGD